MNMTLQAFFALAKAGLWEQDVQLASYGKIDFSVIMKIAEEQSVVGLVTAGLEHVKDAKIPQEWALQFIGATLQIEQRNKAMNEFVATVIASLRRNDVYTLLVKGQGVAQCYERPLWRASGDVDLLLSDSNFTKAEEYCRAIAKSVDEEKTYTQHIAMTIDTWEVELHGTLRSGLWRRLENTIDKVQNEVFYDGKVRSWNDGNTPVFLPGINEDVFFIFSHILQHFFKGGIGLRQICDWSRLLWKYRSDLDLKLLGKRLSEAGIVSEWKAFASLAVNYLGMPSDVMPYYSDSPKWKKKAGRIIDYVLETGNFGHNRDVSYQKKYPRIIRKIATMWRQTKDNMRHFLIFPLDAFKAWWTIFVMGIKDLVEGK